MYLQHVTYSSEYVTCMWQIRFHRAPPHCLADVSVNNSLDSVFRLLRIWKTVLPWLFYLTLRKCFFFFFLSFSFFFIRIAKKKKKKMVESITGKDSDLYLFTIQNLQNYHLKSLRYEFIITILGRLLLCPDFVVSRISTLPVLEGGLRNLFLAFPGDLFIVFLENWKPIMWYKLPEQVLVFNRSFSRKFQTALSTGGCTDIYKHLVRCFAQKLVE